MMGFQEIRPETTSRQAQAYQWAQERAAAQRRTLGEAATQRLEQASSYGRYPPPSQAQSYRPVTSTRGTYSPRTTPHSGQTSQIQLPRISRNVREYSPEA